MRKSCYNICIENLKTFYICTNEKERRREKGKKNKNMGR